MVPHVRLRSEGPVTCPAPKVVRKQVAHQPAVKEESTHMSIER